MTAISDDRWTCDRCRLTFVAHGVAADVAAAIARVQSRHAKEHRAAAVYAARVRDAGG